MKSITLNLDNTAGESLYEQIYNQMKDSILTGRIEAGSRLPSLRRFSDDSGESVQPAACRRICRKQTKVRILCEELYCI